MSPCLSWGYFLKKLGIRRERVRCAIASDASGGRECQTEDLPDMQEQRRPRQNNISFLSHGYDVFLLHPDWRKFPHAPLYGWTNDHEQQLKNLNNMIVNGSLESAYYNSEIEYRAARFMNNSKILPRPNVTNVNEAILLLRRNQGFQYNSCYNESLAEYDADDESENDLHRSMQRYYNHHRARRHMEQQTTY